MKLYMFRTVPLSSIRSYALYTKQWCMSYRFVNSFRAAGSGWHISAILILLLESCLQTCMTHTTPECTVNNSWWWTEELSETCRVSFPKKFEKLVRLFGFIIRKFVTMHGHMNVECKKRERIFSFLEGERNFLTSSANIICTDAWSYLLRYKKPFLAQEK
jgi:hypothetical protein